MEVYLPERFIFQYKQSGIGNAAIATISSLNRLDYDVSWHIVDRRDLKGFSQQPYPLETELKINCEIVAFPRRLEKIWPLLAKPALIKRRADVIWAPCLEAPFVDGRTAIDIPDLTAIKYPDFVHPSWNNKKRVRHLYKNSKRCGAIITHSEYIKRQVIKEFKVNADKVFNIPLGAYHTPDPKHDSGQKELLKRLNISEPYILFVGTIEPRKNISRLIDAFDLIDKKKSFQLVIAGGKGWKAEDLIQRLSSDKFKGRVITTGYLNDKELIGIYSAAKAFVFPSLYEGFGIPLIEAMEFNLPIVSSKALPMPDITKEAAVYFDPYNRREIAACIEKVMFDAVLRNQLIAAGKKRREEFSWDKTAQLTFEVFERVSKSKVKKPRNKRTIACPSLTDLPVPPKGKKGWPWSEESRKLPGKMPGKFSWPVISIVTPTYNQGEFIEETIRSVLLQGYPNIQYIIIDGKSSDQTLEVIKKYEKWLYYWESREDRGQSHAINKGFREATGDIAAWINSDDLYLSGVFKRVAELMYNGEDIDKPMIYASLNFFKLKYDEEYKIHKAMPADFNKLLTLWDKGGWLIPQAGAFMKGEIVKKYLVDESLHLAMDYDLWLRMSRDIPLFCVKDEVFGAFRIHPRAKGAGDSDLALHWELARIAYRFWGQGKDSYIRCFFKFLEYFIWKRIIFWPVSNVVRRIKNKVVSKITHIFGNEGYNRIKKIIIKPGSLAKKALFDIKLNKFHHIVLLPISLLAFVCSRLAPKRSNRILITNTGGLGDILMMSPLVKALAKNQEVDLIVNSRQQLAIFKNQSIYAKVFFVDFYRTEYFKKARTKVAAITKILSFYPIDFLIIFFRNYKAGIVCGHYWWTNVQEAAIMKAAGIPKILGFSNKTIAQGMLSEALKDNDLVGPALYLSFLRHFTDVEYDDDLYFEIDHYSREKVNDILDKNIGERTERKIAIIHPGGRENINSRQWPKENFRQVVAHLTAKGCWVFLTGEGEQDKEICRDVARGFESCTNICGQLSFSELGALLSEADICISNDTSTVHLAEAVKCRILIVIYGPSNSRFLSTRRENVFRVRSKLQCSPCRKSMLHEPEKECIYPEKVECLKDINPSQVIEIIKAKL